MPLFNASVPGFGAVPEQCGLRVLAGGAPCDPHRGARSFRAPWRRKTLGFDGRSEVSEAPGIPAGGMGFLPGPGGTCWTHRAVEDWRRGSPWVVAVGMIQRVGVSLCVLFHLWKLSVCEPIRSDRWCFGAPCRNRSNWCEAKSPRAMDVG